MRLAKPDVKFKDSYLEAFEESRDESGIVRLEGPKAGQTFEQFVKIKLDQAKGKNLPKDFVPATELWLADKGEFIGRISIRHTLNENLRRLGGHIGYWIRPIKRKMGYGRQILKLALIEAGKLGITKILVTCDETNTSSCKIIEANGGVLENTVENGKGNPSKRRYWITL